MKLHFTGPTFSFELLRAVSYGLYGSSKIGEELATANQIREGDKEILKVEMSRASIHSIG